MGKKIIAQSGDPRKGTVKYPSASRFTASELAELAGFDAALEEEDAPLTPEERAAARQRDAAARAEAEPREPGRGKKPKTPEQLARLRESKRRWQKAHPEQVRASNTRYNAAHRQERREYQRAYDAAHREEINARRREKRAAKKAAAGKEGNNGRQI